MFRVLKFAVILILLHQLTSIVSCEGLGSYFDVFYSNISETVNNVTMNVAEVFLRDNGYSEVIPLMDDIMSKY
jgi:hypothetical protein